MSERINLKLTPAQLQLLELFTRYGWDELSVGNLWALSRPLPRHMSAVSGRLNGLKKRGIMVDRHQGKFHLWRLGPMADALMDAGIL